MKRLFASLGVIIAMISLALFWQSSLTRGCDQLRAGMEQTRTYAAEGEMQKALAALEDVERRWEQLHGRWSTMVDHNLMGMAELCINRTRAAIEARDRSLALVEAESFYSALHNILQTELFMVGNLF